jgi:DNA polymerase-4
MAVSTKAVVHVSVERFFDHWQAAHRAHHLDDLMSLTDRLDRTLARYGRNWERPSADEAVLATHAPWGETVQPLDWAGALRDAVHDDVGLDCSVGIASTRFAARICSRIARPRGVLLWLSGYEDRLIASLPLEELDELMPEQLATLRARGVRTLGEMASLPPEQARAALGSQASKLLTLVRGLDRSADRGKGSRLSRAVGLLARRLTRRLERCDRRARGLELRLVFDDGVARERYTLLPRAVAESDELDRAAHRLLEMCPRRDHPVSGLSLTATGLTSGGGQLNLFRREQPREVAVKLGRG